MLVVQKALWSGAAVGVGVVSEGVRVIPVGCSDDVGVKF